MIVHHIDTPAHWEEARGALTISGWCFSHGDWEIVEVRAMGKSWRLEGKFGLARPDVGQAYPDCSDAETSGFTLMGTVPSGKQKIEIQAKDSDGIWHELCRYEAEVPLAGLKANFDTPQSTRVLSGATRFSGWCCHPQHRIRRLKLIIHGQSHECNYRIERRDVAKVYPQWPGSRKSGFEAKPSLDPGAGDVSLEATLDNGRKITYSGLANFVVKPPSLWVKTTIRWRHTLGLVGYVRQLARDRKQRLGRGPKIREWPELAREVGAAYRRWRGTSQHAETAPPTSFQRPVPELPYDTWVRVNPWSARAEDCLRQRLVGLERPPKISIVMPVYNPPEPYFELALQSVFDQVYENWELCMADDASPNPGARARMKALAEQDPRIHIAFRKRNGNISKATHGAAALAGGEYLLFMDQDDVLTPDCLAEIALYLADRPDTDVLYSDDDKITADGERFDPQFKPDWSPELLFSYMYFSHAFLVRKSLFDNVGGTRGGFEGSQDYDLALRVTEQARHIGHIPKILYHWRVLPGSTAAAADEKPTSILAGLKAVRDAAKRRGIAARMVHPEWARQANVGIFAPRFGDEGPSVTIIIPTKNQHGILRRCIQSLEKTAYRRYQVVIVDNESDDPETLAYFREQPHRVLPIANPPGGFNFAHINNCAVATVDTDYVLFLNNDTEVIAPGWLSQMMGYAQLEGVGAVGARLHFPDGRVQHAGIVHGYYHGLAGPAFKLNPEWHNGYLSYVRVGRNYSAVTAACLLTPTALFRKMGGFDANRFGVAYNDVDYGYRLAESGYRCVYCPEARLFHHEGYSRGFADKPAETAYFKQKYSGKVDPYYNPNLSLANERFEIEARKWVAEDLDPIPTLMCAFNLNWEGAPYSQFELTVRLRDMGVIEPLVYCPEDGPLREAYEAQDIPVRIHKHPLAGVATLADYDKAIRNFAIQIDAWNVDLVYGNTLQTFYAIDAAHHAGLPCVWNPRESEPWQTYFSDWCDPIAARALACFQYPYRVVFVADATRERYAPLDSRNNFTVVHNGLNLDRLHRDAGKYTRDSARAELMIGEDEVVCLLLGTVCARKGQKDLIQALRNLSTDTQASIRCFIVGDRPSLYSDELAALRDCLEPALREKVHIIPENPNTALYYRATDVFVCTSRLESYPRVILEAMAHGLPIVTTPVFGIREQVQEHINALLYEPGEVAALAQALSRMIGEPELRKRFAANSKHVLQILESYDDMARAYARIFREAWLSQPDPVQELVATAVE